MCGSGRSRGLASWAGAVRASGKPPCLASARSRHGAWAGHRHDGHFRGVHHGNRTEPARQVGALDASSKRVSKPGTLFWAISQKGSNDLVLTASHRRGRARILRRSRPGRRHGSVWGNGWGEWTGEGICIKMEPSFRGSVKYPGSLISHVHVAAYFFTVVQIGFKGNEE